MPTAFKPLHLRGCFYSPKLEPVPSPLWGDLRPHIIIWNGTSQDGNKLNKVGIIEAHTHFIDLDITAGIMAVAFYNGLASYDVSGSSPLKLGTATFLRPPSSTETDQFVGKVAILRDEPSYMALGGGYGMGFMLIKSDNGHAPRTEVQIDGVTALGLHLARINDQVLVFAATGSGTLVYDWSGTLLHTIPGAASYVAGVRYGGKYYLAVSSGEYVGGLKLYDVSAPLSPVLIKSVAGPTYGVAIWENGEDCFIAIRHHSSLTISSVLGDLKSTIPMPVLSAGHLPVRHSKAGSKHMLWTGHKLSCSNPGEGAELVLDVGNPSSPRNIVPTGTFIDEDPLVPGNRKAVGYFSWYYNEPDRGYGGHIAMAAQFWGDKLYRAHGSIFDAHVFTENGLPIPLPPPLPIPPTPEPPPPVPPPPPSSLGAIIRVKADFDVVEEGPVVIWVLELTGNPDLYQWDWNGDGIYEKAEMPLSSGDEPYPFVRKNMTPGNYRVGLRLRQGTNSATTTTQQFLVVPKTTPEPPLPPPEPPVPPPPVPPTPEPEKPLRLSPDAQETVSLLRDWFDSLGVVRVGPGRMARVGRFIEELRAKKLVD